MSLFSSMRASASGLTAQRLKMDVIAGNIANATTTRTEDGGPYRRKEVIFRERLSEAMEGLGPRRALGALSRRSGGVEVAAVVTDNSPLKMIYDPGHPDANQDGYVAMPNVDIVREMVDMISASRAYEANITAFNSARSMVMKALEIGR